MKIYFVTHKSRSEDAFAICDRVNTVTASNGDSLHRDRVEAELIELLKKVSEKANMTPWELFLFYGMEIQSQGAEIEND